MFRTCRVLLHDANALLLSSTDQGLRRYSDLCSSLGKLLVANRGEIACRIIKTARALGVPTVAVYSDADADAQHVAMANEAVNIGPAPALQSYLNIDALLSAARATGATAVHPGYGFLSENSRFVQSCQDVGITFVGPPVSAIEAMGNKSSSKDIMSKAGVLCVPGYHGPRLSMEGYANEAERIGYPILIKAVLGGGGKGMKIARKRSELKDALESAVREAQASFSDDRILLERLVERPRHVEVQVLADRHGNCVHVFERDCSIQRRHQKVFEEAPAPGFSEQQRNELGKAAVAAAQAVGYEGAGTVEFLMDCDTKEHFFMEMNTRLQVEHPITELISGLDLVEMQLRIAAGEPLQFRQVQLQPQGHAAEVRIYAERPEQNFVPAGGTLDHLQVPNKATSFEKHRASVRWDAAVRVGDTVGVHYDPLIAKLIVWGEDRNEAMHKMSRALTQLQIGGLPTNVDFLRRVVAHKALRAGAVDTRFIEEYSEELLAPSTPPPAAPAIAAVAWLLGRCRSAKQEAIAAWEGGESSLGAWGDYDGFRLWTRQPRVVKLSGSNQESEALAFAITFTGPDNFMVELPGSEPMRLSKVHSSGATYIAEVNGQQKRAVVVERSTPQGTELDVWMEETHVQYSVANTTSGRLSMPLHAGADQGLLRAPMTSRVIKVFVKVGDVVEVGQAVIAVEAMKMEQVIAASEQSRVEELRASEGQTVQGGSILAVLASVSEQVAS